MKRFGYSFALVGCFFFCSELMAQKQCKSNSKQANRSQSGVFASMIRDGGPQRGGAEGRKPPQRGRDGQQNRGQQRGKGQRGAQGQGQDQQRQGFAQEQNPVQRLKMMFQQMDRNRDGEISRREAPEKLRANFDRADRNSDGVLDRQEQMAVMKNILAMMQNRNGDGARRGPQGGAGDGKEKGKRGEGDRERKPPKIDGGGEREFGEFRSPPEKRKKGERPEPEREDGGVFGEF